MFSVSLPTSEIPLADSTPADGCDRPAPEIPPDPTATPKPSSTAAAPVTLAQVLAANQPVPSDRESLKVILVGSRNTVTQTIRQLHKLGFAEAGAWSPLLPTATQGQFMTILNRYWLKDQPPSS